MPVAIDGLRVVAQVAVRIAQAVPGVGGTGPVAESLKQIEGLLAVDKRLPVVAEQGVRPADGIQRPGLAGQMAFGAVQVQCLLGVVEHLPIVALPLAQPCEVQPDVGLAGTVGALTGQLESGGEMGGRVVVSIQPGVRASDGAVGLELPRRVGGLPGGRERGALDSHGLTWDMMDFHGGGSPQIEAGFGNGDTYQPTGGWGGPAWPTWPTWPYN